MTVPLSPLPGMAIVVSEFLSASLCASPSIPRARPERIITFSPCSDVSNFSTTRLP